MLEVRKIPSPYHQVAVCISHSKRKTRGLYMYKRKANRKTCVLNGWNHEYWATGLRGVLFFPIRSAEQCDQSDFSHRQAPPPILHAQLAKIPLSRTDQCYWCRKHCSPNIGQRPTIDPVCQGPDVAHLLKNRQLFSPYKVNPSCNVACHETKTVSWWIQKSLVESSPEN